MRTISAAEIAALQSRNVPLAVLVEMALSTPLNLNTSSLDLTIGGITYYGTRGLGAIDSVQETPAEVRQLRFTLSGVPSTSIALALTEPVQGKLVTLKLAIFDPVTYQVLGAHTRWAGRLDVMAISDAAGGMATLTVTAEHAGIDLIRPGVSLYTDLEQRRLFPGDLFLQYLNDQIEQKIVWPAASWGRE